MHDRNGKFRFPLGVASRYAGLKAGLLPCKIRDRTKFLILAGLLALLTPDVEAVSKALFRHCELRGMKDAARHVSTKNRKFL
jgi:hypothetical protein